ncbi:hypothetical protein [Pandoraea fibrosis]|uniref:Uncharacterized protein n=1 Tax=Pandoraea fibrosis TaxID=1891094 RepID=A0A5E4YH15_9BURK|nr:hypothetical protein [Pandoraea fibrosis]VVE48099.1 hypothetical protein PFI31113_04494 [Pandoraea fibrosis]
MRNNFAVVGSGNCDDVPEQGKTYRSMAALPRWRGTTDNAGTVERAATLGATPQFGESLMIIKMIINNIYTNDE